MYPASFRFQLYALTIGCLLIVDSLSAQPIQLTEDRAREFDELADEVAAMELQSRILRKVARLARPSVVHIQAAKSSSISARYQQNGQIEEAGAGIVVPYRESNYVITNRHVIKDAKNKDITVRLYDGRKYQPSHKWHDQDSDVAVLNIEDAELTPARLGNIDQLDIGDFVMAIGSPFGLSHSATFGIVSAKGRRDLELGDEQVRLQDFIQTDAAINPGNSGGPLLNLRGEVVGVNTAIASNSGGNEGIGFAIPIKMVMTVAGQLIDNEGQLQRAFLGVHLDRNFSTEEASRLGLSRPLGTRITGINNHSPAATAKLQVDDVITQFNGITIEDDGHLISVVGLTPVDTEVEIVVLRNGDPLTIQVTVKAKR